MKLKTLQTDFIFLVLGILVVLQFLVQMLLSSRRLQWPNSTRDFVTFSMHLIFSRYVTELRYEKIPLNRFAGTFSIH